MRINHRHPVAGSTTLTSLRTSAERYLAERRLFSADSPNPTISSSEARVDDLLRHRPPVLVLRRDVAYELLLAWGDWWKTHSLARRSLFSRDSSRF